MNDYNKYRGKCKEMAQTAVLENPNLTLVRGWYHDFAWGMQQHWWCKDQDGNIYDPSANQFPSKGSGDYEEFNGIYKCSNCGKSVNEIDARFDSRYVFCSYNCNLRFVGL